mmetsp:Transcript_16950/g.17639  ORF Transcript_16950/g.17639 Transcript_16950/m.17639 type:complete len:139 (-) Transcript_16950:47-463(-)
MERSHNKFNRSNRKGPSFKFFALGIATGYILSRFQLSSLEENYEKKRTLIANLSFFAEKQGKLPPSSKGNLNNLNNLSTENIEILKQAAFRDEAIVTSYFYFLYKDYFSSSLSDFASWSISSQNKSNDVYEYYKKKIS